jgi:mono/diheme cytochrome c family protein
MNRTRGSIFLAAALALSGFGLWRHATAQQEPPPPLPGGRQGGFIGFGGTQIAVSGDSVYVLRGNALYRLDGQTLAVKATANLPAPAGRNRNGAPAAPPPPPASGGTDAALAAAGKNVIAANGCKNCHSIAGEPGGRAPNLSHIGAEHDAAWIASYVKNPQSIDPGSRMPAFGGKISDKDLQAVGAYLASFK